MITTSIDEPNIVARHSRTCTVRSHGVCTCSPSFQVKVYDALTGGRSTRSFRTIEAARMYRDSKIDARQVKREKLRDVVEAAHLRTSDAVWDNLVDAWSARA